jgi:hypothetical protein
MGHIQMYREWLDLSIGVRHQIAFKLGLEKKFPTEVQDNFIKTDGYVMKDIEKALSIENLQKFLQTDEPDHALLLKWLIEGKPEESIGAVLNPLSRETYEKLPPKIKKHDKNK